MTIAKLQNWIKILKVVLAVVPICPAEDVEKVIKDHAAHLRPAESWYKWP